MSEGDEDYLVSQQHHLQYSGPAYSALGDITATNNNNNYSLERETGEGLRDDKYWERRR